MTSGFIGKARFGSGGIAGAGAAAGGGVPFANVALLLHMDGADGGTTFVDSSSYAHTVSAINLGSTVTGTKKFGTASMSTGAIGGCGVAYAETGNDEFQIVDGKDFTIEAFVNAADAPAGPDGTIFAMDHADSNMAVAILIQTTTGKLIGSVLGGISLLGSTNICDGTWHHVALVRKGITYSLYLDGNRVDTGDSAFTVPSTHGGVVCGRDNIGATRLISGFIDEVRFVNGTAVYDGALYDVPTEAFHDA